MKMKKGRILPIRSKNWGEVIKEDFFQKPRKVSMQTFSKNNYFFEIDLRPFYDKKYIIFCLKEIRLFLFQNGYNNFPLKKIPFILKNKDFFKIMFFLFKKIDKNFKIESVKEENLPLLLKLLGYPLFLNKTFLSDLINLYDSPLVLNCMNWVVELCLYDLKTIRENKFKETRNLKKSFLWNRMIKYYNQFLIGKKIKNRFKKLTKLILSNNFDLKKKSINKYIKFNQKIKKILTFLKLSLFVYIKYNKRTFLIHLFKKNLDYALRKLKNKNLFIIKNFEITRNFNISQKIKTLGLLSKKKKNDDLNLYYSLKKLNDGNLKNVFIINYKIFRQKKHLSSSSKIISSTLTELFRVLLEQKIWCFDFLSVNNETLTFLEFLVKKYFFKGSKNFIHFITKNNMNFFSELFEIKIKFIIEIYSYLELFFNEFLRQLLFSFYVFNNLKILKKKHSSTKNEMLEKHNENNRISLQTIKKAKIKRIIFEMKSTFISIKFKFQIILLCYKNFISNFNSLLSHFLISIINRIKKESLLNFNLLSQ